MGESLTQQRRVGDEGFRIVNPCQEGRSVLWLIAMRFDGTSRGSSKNFKLGFQQSQIIDNYI